MMLKEIVGNTQVELEARKRSKPLAILKVMAQAWPQPVNLVDALKGEGVKLFNSDSRRLRCSSTALA
jgi:hypothetical protein